MHMKQEKKPLSSSPESLPAIHFVSAIYMAHPPERGDYIMQDMLLDFFPKSLEIVGHGAIQRYRNDTPTPSAPYQYTVFTEPGRLADAVRTTVAEVMDRLRQTYNHNNNNNNADTSDDPLKLLGFEVTVNDTDVPDIQAEFFRAHPRIPDPMRDGYCRVTLPVHRNPAKDCGRFLQLINCKVPLMRRVASVAEAPLLMWIDAGFAKILDKPVNPKTSGLNMARFIRDAFSSFCGNRSHSRSLDASACGNLQQSIYGRNPDRRYEIPDWRYLGGWFIARRSSIDRVAQRVGFEVERCWLDEYSRSGKGRLTWETCIWTQAFDIPENWRDNRTPVSFDWIYSDTDEKFLHYENTL
jgi:hypothetical protein